MSVLIETSVGDLVIDLFTEQCPAICLNFLKLCKVKYYNFSLFYNIQKDFTCQTGDPFYPDGDSGVSIWGYIDKDSSKRYFVPNMDPDLGLSHTERGTVSMATTIAAPEASKDGNLEKPTRVAGSQFIITLKDDLKQLDGKEAIFGKVVEGLDVLEKINQAYCDDEGRPFIDIRIKHTYILEDPFDDPEGLVEPAQSPEPTEAQLKTARIGENEDVGSEEGEQESDEKSNERKREQKARSQALALEMMGDLPRADVKPMENVLFVCKLNSVTKEDDLELIFSRFGPVKSCEVVKDKVTGDSLQYAFIEFENKKDCERAYAKMDGVLIDDRRIHVDFSQSVSKIQNEWRNSSTRSRPSSDAKHRKERSNHHSRGPRGSSHRERSPPVSEYRRHKDAARDERRYRERDSDSAGSDNHRNHRDKGGDKYKHRHRQEPSRHGHGSRENDRGTDRYERYR